MSKTKTDENMTASAETKKQGDAEFLQSEEIFRFLVDSVSDYAIFALNTEGRIITWNAGAERLKGYKAEEIIGSHFSKFYTLYDTDRGHPQYELEVAKNVGRYEEEGWRVKKDGTTFWANVVISKITDKEGRHIGFAKVTRDLTEKKIAEENLRSSEEKLRLMIQNVKDYAIYMLDPNGFISSWNEGAQRLKQYTADEILGKHFRQFYSEEDSKAGKPEIELKEAARAGRVEEAGWRIRKDGSRFWANVFVSAIRNAKGELIGFTKVTRDMTLQREAEEKLRASHASLESVVEERTRELLVAKQAAENASITKSTFLANMSHEIRTPLGAIIGFADLMGKGDVSREDVNSYLSVIKRNSAVLLRIIDDILDLSKVEAGKMDIEHIQFSLPELLSDMATMLGLRARENSIRFELTAETALPRVVISDPTRLRQIIINVVGNAIKFTEKGEVKLSVGFADNVLKLTVTDTGRGISEEQAAKLFKPFTQADAATNRKYGGTGLGLALTKGLCEVMGGSFYLQGSTPGKGSTFVASIGVSVPAGTLLSEALESRFVTDSASEDPSKLLEGMRVLLIEDAPDNQRLFQIILSRAGASIDIAIDGLEGVDKALTGNHDVVLMDIQMPRMDGMEAIRILRKKNYNNPVIALTAHAMKEHRTQAFEAGFTDYLSKPIQVQPLMELLNKFWRAARGY